jgi:MoaA/NifB/PqqE/SkfB family radical SAM enzyme
MMWRFVTGFGLRSLMSMERWRRRRRSGDAFPPVLFISLTDRCNLRCQGCWARAKGGRTRTMPARALDRLIAQAKRRGNSFFGLLGGEPLMYDGLWDVLARHQDCYFQLLTNGTLIDAEAARQMRRLGNVTPLISIEGSTEVSDERRGGENVLMRSWAGVEHCTRAGLIVGAATSICRTNFDAWVHRGFARELIARGVHYLWYYIYRPVGPEPAAWLALDEEQIVALRRFIVEQRARLPLLVIDAYWDADGGAVCPAVAGISHHISPGGDVEPCPPIQLAAERLGTDDVSDVIGASEFLAAFRVAAGECGGCVLLRNADLLLELAARYGARDSSARKTVLTELGEMVSRADHDLPGREIQERHWAYRLAKKRWFLGFGAYG